MSVTPLSDMARKGLALIALAALPAPLSEARDPSRPLSPEESLAAIELADEAFQVELFAAEPLIADPVAMEVDEQGRIFVVEMPGYPLDLSYTGRIRQLHDTDGDGIPDKSTIFAEGLRFPNGIQRWRQGFLVTDAPDLLYLEDTDGDGRADKRERILTGFALANPQHIVNSPRFALDNWIYVANEPAGKPRIYAEEFGDPGSELRFPDRTDTPVLPRNANGRRVRVQPEAGRLEALSSATQYGHCSDPWGHQFLVSNSRHIFHEVIQAPYLLRNPALLISSAVSSVAEHGDAAEVFAITEKPEHQMLTSVGVFTSACGNLFYQGGLFPAPFDRVHFVAEPVGNLVHAEVVEEAGATFTSRRLYPDREFLASRDAWFRPVNHYVGPDGAVYLIDYHRRIIEHPEWMAQEVADSDKVRHGSEQGRLFRISPRGTPAADWTDRLALGQEDDAQLVERLGHANAWHRLQAQRLLLHRHGETAPEALRDALLVRCRAGEPSLHRLHAAWTLQGLGLLPAHPEVVLSLLEDPAAGVRENAILLAEGFLTAAHPESERLLDALLGLRKDDSARVRFQLLCTLGYSDRPDVAAARMELLFASSNDPWMQAAALSAAKLDYNGLLSEAIQRAASQPDQWQALIERLATMRSSLADPEEMRSLLALARDEQTQAPGPWQAALLQGVAKGGKASVLSSPPLEAERLALLEQLFTHPRADYRQATLALLTRAGLPQGEALENSKTRALETIRHREGDPARRTLAMAFYALAEPQGSQAILLDCLDPVEPLEIQEAALAALNRQGGVDIVAAWIARWPTLTDRLRKEIVTALLGTPERREALIAALESGAIATHYVTGSPRIRLIAQSDLATRDRLRALFAESSQDEARGGVITSYLRAFENLPQPPSPSRGKLVYQNQCGACHTLGGQHGQALGPDLNSIRIRNDEAILTDILDPNRSIADGYALWQITLRDGTQKVGIVASETSNSLTLRSQGGPEELISRRDIAKLNDLGLSLMPVGLEQLIPPQDMADLLAFLRQPE